MATAQPVSTPSSPSFTWRKMTLSRAILLTVHLAGAARTGIVLGNPCVAFGEVLACGGLAALLRHYRELQVRVMLGLIFVTFMAEEGALPYSEAVLLPLGWTSTLGLAAGVAVLAFVGLRQAARCLRRSPA